MKIRVAAISFINDTPLWWGMKDDPNVDLRLMVPSQTAGCLLDGSADIAVVPTFMAVRNDLHSAAPIGVLSKGDVRSILLFYPRGTDNIRKIFLDPASRTSQAMTRHLFSNRNIAFETGRKDLKSLAPDEAQLLIGDDALKLYDHPMPKLDIATMWKVKTGRCCVFALWAKKKEKLDFDEADFLESSLSRCLDKFDEIIKWAGSKTGLKEPTLRHYFEKSLFYRFGEEGGPALDFCREVFPALPELKIENFKL
jgi:predicted solute-binding protein